MSVNQSVFSSQQVVNSAASAPVDAFGFTKAYINDTFTGSPAGVLKLQVTNGDPSQSVDQWVDVAGGSVAVSGAGSFGIPKVDIKGRWIRSVYNSTSFGAQTILMPSDSGVDQISQIVAVADVSGNLNSKYFNISSVNSVSKAQKDFYVWFNINSAGVDPLVANRTGVVVSAATNATANTIASGIATALALLTQDFGATPSTNTVTVTNVNPGLVTVAANGTASPAFTITTPTPGVNSSINNTYYLLNGPSGQGFYVWFSVSGLGVDPQPVGGGTSIPVAVAGGASATAIGAAMATAISAASSGSVFAAVNGSGTVTVTNKIAGPFEPALDGNTGFTQNTTSGQGLLTATLVLS